MNREFTRMTSKVNSSRLYGCFNLFQKLFSIISILKEIFIYYELSNFDHLLGVLTQTRVTGGNRIHAAYANSRTHYPLDYQGTQKKFVYIFCCCKKNFDNGKPYLLLTSVHGVMSIQFYTVFNGNFGEANFWTSFNGKFISLSLSRNSL